MRKQKKNQKPVMLMAMVMIAIFTSYIILYGNWLDVGKVEASNTNGTEATANTLTSGSDSLADVAKSDNGNYVVTWTSNGQGGDADSTGQGVYYQLYDSSGAAQLPNAGSPADQLANTTTIGDQENSAVTMDQNGNFIIAWSDNNNGGGTYDIYVQAFDSTGTRIGAATKINDTSSLTSPHPDISMDYNYFDQSTIAPFAVTWESSSDGLTTDIKMAPMYVDYGDTAGPLPTSPGSNEKDVNTYTTNNQSEPRVAMSTSSEFMVTWSGEGTTPSGNHIWYQAYSVDGSAIGSNTKVNSSTVTTASKPSISTQKKAVTIDDGLARNFFISYDGSSVDDNAGIYGRSIQCIDSGAGLACSLGAVELTINSTASGTQTLSDVDMDYLGNFTVVWQDSALDGSGKGIYGQSFSFNDGYPYGALSRLGAEFRINTTTNGDQAEPAIGMNGNGQYVVAFASGSTPDVKTQQYVSDLFKTTTETLASSVNAISESSIDVAVAPNGNYAAVWVSPSPRGIYFTLWDSDDNVLAQSVRIDDSGVTNDDDNPSISFFKDTQGSDVGKFIIAWSQSAPTCGSGYSTAGTDIWYREVSSIGTPVGSCEKKVHAVSSNDAADSSPQVAAGYYNNDGGANEDTFAVAYLHEPSLPDVTTIRTAYHSGDTPVDPTTFTDFTLNDVNTSCTNCLTADQEVDLDPSNNHIVYTWSDVDENAENGIYIRQANAASLIGSAQRINALNGLQQLKPSIGWLPNNQFIMAYTEADSSFTTANMIATRYQFNGSGSATEIDAPFTVSTFTDPSGPQVYGKVASDSTNGTFLVTWTDLPSVLEDNQIYGQLYTYLDSAIGGIAPFGSIFFINSTQAGSQTLPSASMNSSGTTLVGWEGNFQDVVGTSGAGDDSAGAVTQVLRNPLYADPYPELQPEAQQEILAGGRTLNVPSDINFPNATVNTASATSVDVSIRDNTLGEPDPIQYIEFEDLDGVASVISVSASDFILASDSQVYIEATAMAVKNCDQDLVSDGLCISTINGDPAAFDLSNAETADDTAGTDVFYNFTSSLEQKTLGTKSGSGIGKWRFFPEFRLTIPAITPPGDHNATVTFSLT